MSSSRHSSVTCLAVLALICLDGRERLPAQDAPAWKERFQDEAPREWSKYRKRAARLQGSFLWAKDVIQSVPATKSRSEGRHEIKQREGCALFLEERLVERNQKSGTGWLRVVNPRYGFELHRHKPTGPWAVTRVDLDPGDGLSLEAPGQWVEKISTFPFNFSNMVLQLDVIVGDPGFTLKRVSPVTRDGRELARVEFSYRPKDLVRVPLRGGWVLYDPERFWVIKEYEVQMDWKRPQGAWAVATVTATYDYQEGDDRFPILKRIVRTEKMPSERWETQHTAEFDLTEADVPERDFTLPAFGFPEPPGAKKPPVSWYLWAAVAAVPCLGLAFLLRRLSRRNAVA